MKKNLFLMPLYCILADRFASVNKVGHLFILLCVFAGCKNVIHPAENAGYNENQAQDAVISLGHKNVIVILGDDIGYEVPTCDGGQSYQTPSLNNMAAHGRRFTQCHSSPLCSPSRFALLTGEYNFRNYFDWGHLGQDQKTIANMFHDAGYKTFASGKWQLGGGEVSMHVFGFDGYCLWNATGHASDKGSRYKDPVIYTNANFLAPQVTAGKYGEDIFCDSVLNFISNNKDNPFFVYYAMVNTHKPFSPTPDDPEFAAWDPASKGNDNFFPSMVQYADKKIGAVINKVNELGLAQNTVIVYVGDNGTASSITSTCDGQPYQGGKGQTNEHGTHVPCIIWGAGVSQGIDTSLICFQDFFPTLADISGLNCSGYGTLDGISFCPQIKGLTGTPRQWIYNYYTPLENSNPDTTITEWVQDRTYKLDLVNGIYTFKYVGSETPVLNPTPEQVAIRRSFKSIISSMPN